MIKARYIEKSTGEWWYWCGYTHKDDVKVILIRKWDDKNGEYTNIPEEEFNEKFEYMPFDKPSIDIEPVIPRHPIHIVMHCPLCGSPLEVKGGAILTYPLQYENVCSNSSCNYGGICTSSYYSGMYAAVTDEQEVSIMNGNYNVREHGEIIQLDEKDLWKFKE